MKKTLLITGLLISLLSSVSAQVAPKKDTLVLNQSIGDAQIIVNALYAYKGESPSVLMPIINYIVLQSRVQLAPPSSKTDSTQSLLKPVADSAKIAKPKPKSK